MGGADLGDAETPLRRARAAMSKRLRCYVGLHRWENKYVLTSGA